MDEFYLQDSRSYVGNDVLWWANAGRGQPAVTSNYRISEPCKVEGGE